VPACYKNWARKLTNCKSSSIIEVPLFSDPYSFVDDIEIDHCPYQIINPYTIYRENLLLMRLLLRVENFDSDKTPAVTESDEEVSIDLYLENNLPDQIAVLLSLCLGVRIKAGGPSRIFQDSSDRFGTPIAHNIHDNPPAVRLATAHAVLPSALKNLYEDDSIFSLSSIESYISSFIKLTPNQAELLIRAAKLYRDALWLIETEPQLSWIMLVSAIEVIAADHIKSNSCPIDIFREKEPNLAAEIEESGGEQLLSKIADKFVEKKFVMQKYKKFLLEFLPEPPSQRPPHHMQINWEDLKGKTRKNPLMKIYQYRSTALHAGKPFPLDMCYKAGKGNLYELAEKPSAISTFYNGENCLVEPGPMLIST
jgi:hypothetical protein